jgi:tetratricopeptide (TPR) repeat protein
MLVLLSSVKVQFPAISRAVVACFRILLVISITSLAALPLLGQGKTARVEGTIRVEGGQVPGTGVIVRVETEDGDLVAQTPATSSGGFILDGVVKKIIKLVVTASGFETFQENLDLSRGANIFEVTVNLVPARKTERSSVAPALSDAQAPKNAQREYEMGDTDLTAQKLDEARTHLEKAVAYYPCFARAQTELAMVLAEKRKIVEAEAAAKKARDCDPDFLESYMQLGMILNNEKKFGESEAALQEGIRRAPAQWQFYYQLAVAHYGEGQFSKADVDCQRVLSINPSPPAEFRVKLADIYLKENLYDKAFAEMQEYLKTEPNGPFAQKVKNIMQQMQAAGAVQKDKS